MHLRSNIRSSGASRSDLFKMFLQHFFILLSDWMRHSLFHNRSPHMSMHWTKFVEFLGIALGIFHLFHVCTGGIQARCGKCFIAGN